MFTRTRTAPINPTIADTLGDTLNEHEMSVLSAFGTLVQLPQGQRFATEGAIGREAVVIVAGTADVLRDGATIAQVGVGSILGERSLLTGEPRNASIVATSPVTVSVLNAREFASMLELCPRLDKEVHELAAARAA